MKDRNVHPAVAYGAMLAFFAGVMCLYRFGAGPPVPAPAISTDTATPVFDGACSTLNSTMP